MAEKIRVLLVDDEPGIIKMVGKRLELGYIFSHLKGRHRANPYAPEPYFDLTDKEAAQLTRFLTSVQARELD